jgi:hypothetical protein
MAEYLPPINIAEIFNVGNFEWQNGFIIYREADQRYLRPIQNLQQNLHRE